MSCSGNAVSYLIAFFAVGAIIAGANAKAPSRIIGGLRATDGVFQGTVTLSRPGEYYHACGGGIIGARHILTAAHCVEHGDKSRISVHAGSHNIEDRENIVERLVEKMYIHPGYVPYIEGQQHTKNDLAILVLTKPLKFNDRIQPFKLPIRQPDRTSYYTLGGWGQTTMNPEDIPKNLKALSMKLGDARTCKLFPPKVLCAYSNGGSPCYGDSGSPLIKGGYVYGIVSTVNCDVKQLTGFVNVYEYMDWIKPLVH